MLKTKQLSDAQIYDVIKNGEFDTSIINSKKNVAIIMSQSWCPQWMIVNNWIATIPQFDDLDIYIIIYDKEKYYDDFLSFKENNFGNYEVPYIRYYIDGKLVKETNYTSKDFFLSAFNLK